MPHAYRPTICEAMALEEETESGTLARAGLASRRGGFDLFAGEGRNESGDGFERLMHALQPVSRMIYEQR